MANSDNVTLWYFVGMNKDNSILHVEHDVLASGEDGSNQAKKWAQQWFDRGIIIKGELVEFDRVVAISEYHETALDIRKAKEDDL